MLVPPSCRRPANHVIAAGNHGHVGSGCRKALHNGKAVPQEIVAVIAYDSDLGHSYSPRPMSSVDPRVMCMGRIVKKKKACALENGLVAGAAGSCRVQVNSLIFRGYCPRSEYC
jgi:hypothetical protein